MSPPSNGVRAVDPHAAASTSASAAPAASASTSPAQAEKDLLDASKDIETKRQGDKKKVEKPVLCKAAQEITDANWRLIEEYLKSTQKPKEEVTKLAPAKVPPQDGRIRDALVLLEEGPRTEVLSSLTYLRVTAASCSKKGSPTKEIVNKRMVEVQQSLSLAALTVSVNVAKSAPWEQTIEIIYEPKEEFKNCTLESLYKDKEIANPDTQGRYKNKLIRSQWTLSCQVFDKPCDNPFSNYQKDITVVCKKDPQSSCVCNEKVP